MVQHFVPKVYLKNFGVKRQKGYFVDVYDRTTKKKFNTNIRNICGELHLYTLSDPKYKDPLIVEKVYSEIFEPLYAEVYRNLIDDNILHINSEIRVRILAAVFQLYFRNVKILLDAVEFHIVNIRSAFQQAALEQVGAFIYFNYEFYLLKDWDSQIQEFENSIKESFKLGHAEGFYQLMRRNSSQIIRVYKIVDESKFMTCDNPLFTSNFDGTERNPFLRVSEFYLPLNEQYCLHLFNDVTLDPNIISRRSAFNGMAITVNQRMLRNANRFIIGDYQEIERLERTDEIVLKYETNDKDFISLLKNIVKVLMDSSSSSEIVALCKHFINLYEKQGVLTAEEMRSFYDQGNIILKNLRMMKV